MQKWVKYCGALFLGLLLKQASADNAWRFLQENDALNNRVISSAHAPRPQSGVYDNIKLTVVCSDNKLRVELSSDVLIASQGSLFDVEYQIDKTAPVKVRMRAFPDSKRKGYTEEFAKSILDGMLQGQTLLLKVNTMIGKVLSAGIALQDSSGALNQVINACADAAPQAASAYSFENFQQEFTALSAERQQQALQKMRVLMQELH